MLGLATARPMAKTDWQPCRSPSVDAISTLAGGVGRKEGDALTPRAQAVGVALSARSGKVRPTPNREPEISCPLEVRANPAQHPGLCMPRDPSGTAAPSHFYATCFWHCESC